MYLLLALVKMNHYPCKKVTFLKHVFSALFQHTLILVKVSAIFGIGISQYFVIATSLNTCAIMHNSISYKVMANKHCHQQFL